MSRTAFLVGSRTASRRRRSVAGRMTSRYLPRTKRSRSTSSAMPQTKLTIDVSWLESTSRAPEFDLQDEGVNLIRDRRPGTSKRLRRALVSETLEQRRPRMASWFSRPRGKPASSPPRAGSSRTPGLSISPERLERAAGPSRAAVDPAGRCAGAPSRDPWPRGEVAGRPPFVRPFRRVDAPLSREPREPARGLPVEPHERASAALFLPPECLAARRGGRLGALPAAGLLRGRFSLGGVPVGAVALRAGILSRDARPPRLPSSARPPLGGAARLLPRAPPGCGRARCARTGDPRGVPRLGGGLRGLDGARSRHALHGASLRDRALRVRSGPTSRAAVAGSPRPRLVGVPGRARGALPLLLHDPRVEAARGRHGTARPDRLAARSVSSARGGRAPV